MKLKIERSFGVIEIENSDSKELIKEASFWQELPDVCAVCGENVRLFYRSPQDNDYFGLVCTGKTRHETNFGQLKKGGLYYKNEWHQVFRNVVEERNAEIAKHDGFDIRTRIENAKSAIKGLGFNPVVQGDRSAKDYFEALVVQYNQLKGSGGTK